MLPSLAWIYRWTGDEAFKQAAEKLIAFLTRFVYPDGISVGPFDVRNSNVLAYFPTCAGLELTTTGRAYSARAFRLWHDLGLFTEVSRSMVCTRDLARLAFYVADTVRYLSQFAPRLEQVVDARGQLAIDRDGVLENHSAAFDGLLVRQGPWVLALSSQDPDYPRQGKSPYMLDGQSRVELWHPQARLVLGGGHSHRSWAIPFANVFILTDQSGQSEFGRPPAGLTREARNACFMPQHVSTRVQDGSPELELRFAQGTVRFRFDLRDEHRVEIVAAWQVEQVKGLCLQLPVVVWRGAEFRVDGTKQTGTMDQGRVVRRGIEVTSGPWNTPFRLQVPEGVPCRAHYPLTTGQFHDLPLLEDPIRNPFDLALVSSQWLAPPKMGRATFVVSL
jgi:hypothetical protein